MVALLESAPTVVVGFGVESDFFLGGLGEIVEEDKVGGFVEFLGADAVLSQGEFDAGDLETGFLKNLAPESLLGQFID